MKITLKQKEYTEKNDNLESDAVLVFDLDGNIECIKNRKGPVGAICSPGNPEALLRWIQRMTLIHAEMLEDGKPASTGPNMKPKITLQPCYSPILVCDLVRIECHKNTLRFYFPEYQCCDCSGCIQLAQEISPEVKEIQTWSGDKEDNVYVLVNKRTNKWETLRKRPQPTTEN